MKRFPFPVTVWQSLFYIVLPILSFLFILAWAYRSPGTFSKFAGGEVGILEISHILFALLGLVFGLVLIVHFIREQKKWGVLLSIFSSLVCLYIAGEEASYGQHFFNWEVDEVFLEFNDQQESNVHNISSWFDQKPRAILEITIVLGGLLLPLFPSIMMRIVPPGLRAYAPTLLFLPISILVILSRLPERLNLQGKFVFPEGVRYSEIQELYLFMFIALYLHFVLRLEITRKATR